MRVRPRPGPSTSRPHPKHKVYPYLLRGLDIVRANQVWATDITYIPMARGFVYLIAIIDWYSRMVFSGRLSNALDTRCCVSALDEALRRWGTPEIFNTDQGAQFTAAAWIDVLKDKGISISMDGKGRCLDNIFVERRWRSVRCRPSARSLPRRAARCTGSRGTRGTGQVRTGTEVERA